MPVSITEDRRGAVQAVFRKAKNLVTGSAVPVGRVRWGSLRRTRPISMRYGYDRGKPVDRFYIEAFLQAHSLDIKGRVLEIKEPEYTLIFGGPNVTQSDVLDIDRANGQATIFADLNEPTELPGDAFDCIVFTHTLQYIFCVEQALRGLHRSLRPGGVLLMTVPGLSPTPVKEKRYWAFTEFSVEQLLGEIFGESGEIRSFGNVLAATAFLYGLCGEELSVDELNAHDPDYPVIVSARYVKAA